MNLNVENISLRDLLADVCMNMKIVATNKGIDLAVDELTDVRFMGDELKLRRMLLNIIENGIKYTQKGSVVTVSSSAENGYAHITVRDNGVGISKDDLKYIFDRFYRADRSRKRESGSGLGLSISKWIAEAHKVTIEVESQLSAGSQFSIKLPL